MSWIYKDFYIHNPLLLWPVLSMMLFMVVFVAAALRAWRPRDPDRMHRLGEMPLSENEAVSPERKRHG